MQRQPPGCRFNIKTLSHQHQSSLHRIKQSHNYFTLMTETPMPEKTVFMLKRAPSQDCLYVETSPKPQGLLQLNISVGYHTIRNLRETNVVGI